MWGTIGLNWQTAPGTLSIVNGMPFGFIPYTFLKFFTGKYKEINPLMYLLSVIYIIHLVIAQGIFTKFRIKG